VSDPARIAARFVGAGVTCRPLGGGHINDSWVASRGAERWFLQRLNRHVFPDPRAVMANVAAVTAHVRAAAGPVSVPALLAADDGRAWVEDEAGDTWRCHEYAPGIARLVPRGPEDAREAARAFGAFARALASYAGPPVAEVLPGFHDTAARVEALERVIDEDPVGRARACKGEILGVLQRWDLGQEFPPLLEDGRVPIRLAHNDAKIANVLFDEATGRARWVVDLDTVMPGTLLHDFGDLVRSSVAHTPEDGGTTMEAEPALFEALAEGFMGELGEVLTPAEREHLETAGRVITFEQAVRFLTDHLRGDPYYGATTPDRNLWRARTQLVLLASLEKHRERFRAVVERLAPR
jgi:Ser/Thr protein kinase RdoA (MazF antagonist)